MIEDKIADALRAVPLPEDLKQQLPYDALAAAAMGPILDALPSHRVMVERLAWHLCTETEDVAHELTATTVSAMWHSPNYAARRASYLARAQVYLDIMLAER